MLVGIDPDIIKSGIAIYQNNKLSFQMLDFIDLCAFIIENKTARFIIEKGEANRSLFNARKGKNISTSLKIAMNTGKNYAVSDLLIQFCIKNNIDFKIYIPKGEKRKKEFYEKFNIFGAKNQELRDALRCIEFAVLK